MHADLETIQRLLHDELPAQNKSVVRAHLAQCTACRARVEMLQLEDARLNTLLQRLDGESLVIDAADIARTARTRTSRVRWAAGLLLSLGMASAAYAIPGSPLREWLQSMVAPDAAVSDSDAVAPVVADPESGIAVMPGAQFAVRFNAAQPSGTAMIRISDGQEIAVSTLRGSARFSSDENRLDIDNQGSTADFRIAIPRTAVRVEIWIGDRLVFRKDGLEITTKATRDTADSYLLPLSNP